MATKIYTDLWMQSNSISGVNEISFKNDSANKVSDNGPALWLQGNDGMLLKLANSTGVIAVDNCHSFVPSSTAAGIYLGNIISRWKRFYLGSDGIYFNDGTIQTTAGGGAAAIHEHSSSSDGGETLNPKYLYMSTDTTARFRLPVGTNMY